MTDFATVGHDTEALSTSAAVSVTKIGPPRGVPCGSSVKGKGKERAVELPVGDRPQEVEQEEEDRVHTHEEEEEEEEEEEDQLIEEEQPHKAQGQAKKRRPRRVTEGK